MTTDQCESALRKIDRAIVRTNDALIAIEEIGPVDPEIGASIYLSQTNLKELIQCMRKTRSMIFDREDGLSGPCSLAVAEKR